jgi:protein-S-isoprenylcysteine O-methyltransferase Ste14
MEFSHLIALIMGSILLLTGLSFLAWANVLFVVYGEGTLALWDHPKKLVVLGPYRYVRNPIAIGLITALWGMSLIFNSFPILYWSLLYWAGTQLWLIYREEPGLAARFGEVYDRYKEEVPRWIPLDKPVAFDP